MPNKSKRNRRRFEPRREFIGQTTPNINTDSQSTVNRQDKGVGANSYAYKTQASILPSGYNFFNDLKWIGLATGVIIILLIISYYIFH